jgi:hypothetical protein
MSSNRGSISHGFLPLNLSLVTQDDITKLQHQLEEARHAWEEAEWKKEEAE